MQKKSDEAAQKRAESLRLEFEKEREWKLMTTDPSTITDPQRRSWVQQQQIAIMKKDDPEYDLI